MTHDLSVLRTLHHRCVAATGPDRELDGLIWAELDGRDVCEGPSIYGPRSMLAKSRRAPHDQCVVGAIDPNGGFWTYQADLSHVAGSVDAALELVGRRLPGWCIRIGTCSVSDDAWLAPDPAGPDAHLLQYRQFDDGFDIDRRQSGNMPLALLEALLEALIAKQEATPPRSTIPPVVAGGG